MDISKPTFSVVIAVYNRVDLIHRTLNSVLSQTYTNYEVIIVDDGSFDGTDVEIEKYNSYDNFKIYKLPKNTGQAFATNYALSKVSGEWICFLDSDDTWLSERLSVMHNFIKSKKSQCGLYYCASNVFSGGGEFLRINKALYSGSDSNLILEHNPIGGQSRVIVNKSVIGCLGGLDVNLITCKDWDLWVRISKIYPVFSINEPLVNYYETDDSISSNCEKLIEGRIMFWNKHYPQGFPKREKGVGYFMLAKILYNRGDIINSRRYFIKSFHRNYFSVKVLTYFIFSYLPKEKSIKLFNLISRLN